MLSPPFACTVVVGLVFVSHSRPLADALVSFVRDMSGEDLRIEVAAGTGPKGEEFGTDATAIAAAIEAADDGDGVLVMVDVGSAVMSAEMALDLIDDALRSRVRLSPAPLVEGGLSAAVTAAMNADLAAVDRESRSALQDKADSVESALPNDRDEAPPGSPRAGASPPAPDDTPPSSASDAADVAVSVEVDVVNQMGLHQRPAATFVRTSGAYDASIKVSDLTSERGPVDGTSVSAVMALGAVGGHRVRLDARGPEAESAVEDLAELIRSGFGEPTVETTGSDRASASPGTADPVPAAAGDADPALRDDALDGIPVASGYVVEPAHVHRHELPEIPDRSPDDRQAEWDRLSDTLDQVRAEMEHELRSLNESGHGEAADILGAQQMLLDDPALRDRAREAILREATGAERAWMDAVDAVIDTYAATGDSYLAQRADDVRDVAIRVVQSLLDADPQPINGPDRAHVLVVRRLRPSDVPTLDAASVRAVICAEGNETSHAAILLRGRSIPAVFGVCPNVLTIDEGTPIGVDGETGLVWIRPSEDIVRHLGEQSRAYQQRLQTARARAQEPATTGDGTAVRVEANVSRLEDAEATGASGADGVGLLRTEFLFLDADDAPTEDEQVEVLSQIAEQTRDGPITIRALDVGGDKPLRYLPLPHEDNPFLGLRGVRVLLRYPSLFKSQIRAILRVGAHHTVRMLLPMVATPSEVQRAREMIDEACRELKDEGVEHAETLPLGSMVETPASAVAAETIVPHVDFFSIGTNDLTQYTMAADREHSDLGDLTSALQPPVLHLIRQTVDAAKERDCPVSVCGEIAGDHDAIPILLGLGVRRLSVAPALVAEVKAKIRNLHLNKCQALAAKALRADDARAVRSLAREFYG